MVILGLVYTNYEDSLTTLSLSKMSTGHREALEKFASSTLTLHAPP
ncbi:hypothetical protein E2C01_094422 [Portunus trituberculatus]|uniref:Uncharacterized protein n=1 Tax=Portunus trituberculatus TaxID=210409 RepID=A0A5B7K1L8_PORTR|nr:hypothetical protein [Portunus trituberculatus]